MNDWLIEAETAVRELFGVGLRTFGVEPRTMEREGI